MFKAIQRMSALTSLQLYEKHRYSGLADLESLRESAANAFRVAISFPVFNAADVQSPKEELQRLLYFASIEVADKHKLEAGMQMYEACLRMDKAGVKNSKYYALKLVGALLSMMGEAPDRRTIKTIIMTRGRKKDFLALQKAEGMFCELFENHERVLLCQPISIG